MRGEAEGEQVARLFNTGYICLGSFEAGDGVP